MVALSREAQIELERFFADKPKNSIRIYLAPEDEAVRICPWLWMSQMKTTMLLKSTDSPSAWKNHC